MVYSNADGCVVLLTYFEQLGKAKLGAKQIVLVFSMGKCKARCARFVREVTWVNSYLVGMFCGLHCSRWVKVNISNKRRVIPSFCKFILNNAQTLSLLNALRC